MPNQRLTTLTELQYIPKVKDVMDIIKSKEVNDIFLRTISAAVLIINETHQPFYYYRHCSNINSVSVRNVTTVTVVLKLQELI